MVNAVSMDNVEHAYAVQQLRKSGKNAKIVSLKIFAEFEFLDGMKLHESQSALNITNTAMFT